MPSVLKLLMFIISNIGYWEFFRKNSKINCYFFPSLTIALQTTILFAAGLLNILQEMTIILSLIGLLSFGYSMYKEKGITFLKSYFNIGFFFLAITSFIMLVFVKGKIFSNYDNFSHWAIVVKNMINTNRYPNFEDSIIEFQEYPLGSATYIYFFSKLVSINESIQMFAQIYMMLTCILPIFIFCKKNNVYNFVALLTMTNFFFVYNTSVTNLLVDTLLPIVAMCSMLYAYFYGRAASGKTEMFFCSFYLIQLIQIKNSGIFFVVLICLWLLINIKNDKRIILRLKCIAAPFLSLVLWHKHCKYVFASAASSKHAMTITNYKSVFGEKTIEDIRLICMSMIKFATTWKDAWFTFAFVILVGVMVFFLAKNERSTYLKISILSFVLYVVYQCGMLTMYLFSMPGKEATSLAGNTRYTKTLLIVILYLTMIVVVKTISNEQIKKIKVLVATAFIILLFSAFMKCSLGIIKLAIQNPAYPEERLWIESAKLEYNVPEKESYCILIKNADAGYSNYLGRYIFQTTDISSVLVENEDDMDAIASKYIFLYDYENEIVSSWIKANYPDQFGNKVIVRREPK